MDICLIAPPTVRVRYNTSGVYPMPPLGLAYIAAVLEKEGYGVEIYDMPALKAGIPQLERYLDTKNFYIYGLTCNIFNIKYAVEIANFIKARDKKSKIILGGRCTSLPPEAIFKLCDNLDIIVHGEGEQVMLELCKFFDNKDNEPGKIAGVKGISYKSNGKVIKTETAPFIDLDTLPAPARYLLPNNRYKMHPPFGAYPPLTIMETSRGCAYKCSFCSLPAPVRERSVSNIISEIKGLVSNYGIKEVHFVDPNFTYNPDRIKKLCNQMIEDKINIHWSCKTRVDLVSQDLLRLMSQSGCYMVSYGVESGRQDILGLLNKQITTKNTLDAFEWTHKAGIRSLAYAIIGYPGEDDSAIEATKALVHRINPDFVLYNEFFLIPGSPLANQYLLDNKLDYDGLVGFYFQEGSSDISRTRYSGYLKRLNKAFYCRFSYVLMRIMKIRNLQDAANMVKGVAYLIIDKIRSKRIF